MRENYATIRQNRMHEYKLSWRQSISFQIHTIMLLPLPTFFVTPTPNIILYLEVT